MFSFLFPIIYVCDLFKTPFLLRFEGNKKSSTYIGALLSIGVFTAICVSFFQSDMIHKNSPNVIEKVISTYSANTANSPSISLDSRFGLIPFSFGLADYARNIYQDKTIFSIDSYHTFQYGNSTIFKIEPMPTRPCQPEDTPLKFNQVNLVTCVPKGRDYEIQGASQDDIFISIGFSLRVCNPSDNVTCQSPEAIAAFLSDKYFFIYSPDYTFDVNNYENPIKAEYRFKITKVSLTQSSMMLQYYQKASFQSDNNWLYSSPEETIVFNKDYDETTSAQLQVGQFMYMNNYSQPLIMYYFGTSKTQHIIIRKYQKLQEALANVAGISNTLVFIGFILTGFQSRLSMVTKIIKSLYVSQHKSRRNKKKHYITPDKKEENKFTNSPISFDKPIPRESKELSSAMKKQEETANLVEQSPIKNKDVIVEMQVRGTINTESNKMFTERQDLDMNMTDSKGLINDSQTLIKKNDENKVLKFQKYINKNYRVRGLKLTSYKYIKAQLRKSFGKPLNDEQKLILKAEEIYNKEIDIITILTKLQDIEKLKKILLSDDQLALFELLDKPRIYGEKPDDERENTKSLSTLSAFSPKKKKEDALVATGQIYFRMIEKKDKSSVELRLLELLEEDVEEYDQNTNLEQK